MNKIVQKNKYLLFVLANIITFSIFAQDKYYMTHNYSIADGVESNSIMSICQDKVGYMWFGNDLGLSRFDGKTFFNKAIPDVYNNSAFVEYIEKLPDGNIATTGFMLGLYIQQKNSRFNLYSILPRRVGRNVFNCIKSTSNGQILVSGAHLLYKYSAGKLDKIYDYGSNQQLINTLEIDKKGRIWFGGALGLGYFIVKNKNLEPIFISEFKNTMIIKVLFDKDMNLHIGTSQGYYKLSFNPIHRNKYNINQPFTELSNTFINHLYTDSNNNLWIATSTKGVYRVQKNRINLNLTQENGLISSTIMCTYQDREGNYWFGTNSGISMIKDFENYSLAYNNEQFNRASDVTKDKFGRIWFTNRDGLYLYTGNKIQFITTKGTILEEGGILSVRIDSKSEMWIANHLGLYKLQLTNRIPALNAVRIISDFRNEAGTRLKSLQIDASDNVWICLQNKILSYQNGKILHCVFNHPDSATLRPAAIVQDKWKNVWIGDYTYGLYRASVIKNTGNSLTFDSIKAYKCLKPDSSFVTAWIQDMMLDKHNQLWIASLYTGAYKLSLNQTGVKQYKLYAVSTGLTSNLVSSINTDSEENIWFFSQKGIDVLNNKSGTFLHYNSTTDMEGQAYNAIVSNNKQYLVFEKGVYVSTPKRTIVQKTDIPEVTITNLIINGTTDTTYLNTAQNCRLSHLFNNLTFEFAAISFRHNNDIRYQYMLKGADTNWRKPTDRQSVDYSSLSPGNYTFMVRAISETGLKGTETAFSFRIYPPFYNTIWFYLLATSVIFLTLRILYKYRIRQILKIERMRSQIASDLHDEIGSTLSSISIMSEIISNRAMDDNTNKAMQNKIGENARNMMNAMDDIIWSVNPTNDKFDNLILRIKEYAIPIFETKGIKLNIYTNGPINEIKLGMDKRRNLFLIIKEALNNTLKHSECTEANLEFNISNQLISVVITDNGKGFDVSKPTNRNGLKNFQKRAELINAEISIKSSTDKGTTILLSLRNH